MAKKQPSTEKKSKAAAKPAASGAKPAKGVKAAKNVAGAPASAAEAKSPAPKSPAPKKPAAAAPKAPARVITLEEIGLAAGEVWGALSNGNGDQTLATIKKSVDAPADLVLLALGWLAREDKLAIDADGGAVTIGLK